MAQNNVTLPLNFYGVAIGQDNGATILKSPDLTISKITTGHYLITPNVHLDPTLTICIPSLYGGFTGFISAGVGSDSTITVLTFDAGHVAADASWQVLIYTLGVNAITSAPVY